MYLSSMLHEVDEDGLLYQVQEFVCPACMYVFGERPFLGIMKKAKFCPICGANLKEWKEGEKHNELV